MTSQEQEICRHLGSVRFLPGTQDKKLAHLLYYKSISEPAIELSEIQTQYMYRLLYKYRKQIPLVYQKYGNHVLCRKKQPNEKYID